MKRLLKRIGCFAISLFFCFCSIPFHAMTVYGMEAANEDADSFELFDALQDITWNEESINILLSDPEICNNVTIARASYQASYTSSRDLGYYKFSCLGRFYYGGKLYGDKVQERSVLEESDISNFKFPVMQPVIAIKFSGNEADTNMCWIVCNYTGERTQYKPDGTLAADENEALQLAGEYGKENGYKAGLEKYLSVEAANAFEAAYTNYFEYTPTGEKDAGYDTGDSTTEVKKKNNAEKSAADEKRNAVLKPLKNLVFTDALLADSDVAAYISDYDVPHEKDGKYFFEKDGDYIVACSIFHATGNSLLKYTPGNTRAAIKLNGVSISDDGIDYWYIVQYDATGKKGTAKKTVIEALDPIAEKIQAAEEAKEVALDSIDEAGSKGGNIAGVDGTTEEGTSDVTYQQAAKAEQYEKVNKIDFHINPLEELEELDFSSDGDVGLTKLKSTAASFYKFISLIATVGMVISLFMMSVKIMIGGKKEAKASIVNMIYKFVIFACICGFVNLWAIFYPIVQSLML